MRNKYLFSLLAISAIVLLCLPFTRSLLLFSVGSLVRSLSQSSCYSIPESPKQNDPSIPSKSQRKTTLTSSEKLVSQVARDLLGEEFIYARAGKARSLLPKSEFEQGDKWIDVWVENVGGLEINRQREHWNPKISEMSRKIFQNDPTVDGLEFRLYYDNNLTYWVRTSHEAATSDNWYQVRYSECKEAS